MTFECFNDEEVFQKENLFFLILVFMPVLSSAYYYEI